MRLILKLYYIFSSLGLLLMLWIAVFQFMSRCENPQRTCEEQTCGPVPLDQLITNPLIIKNAAERSFVMCLLRRLGSSYANLHMIGGLIALCTGMTLMMANTLAVGKGYRPPFYAVMATVVCLSLATLYLSIYSLWQKVPNAMPPDTADSVGNHTLGQDFVPYVLDGNRFFFQLTDGYFYLVIMLSLFVGVSWWMLASKWTTGEALICCGRVWDSARVPPPSCTPLGDTPSYSPPILSYSPTLAEEQLEGEVIAAPSAPAMEPASS